MRAGAFQPFRARRTGPVTIPCFASWRRVRGALRVGLVLAACTPLVFLSHTVPALNPQEERFWSALDAEEVVLRRAHNETDSQGTTIRASSVSPASALPWTPYNLTQPPNASATFSESTRIFIQPRTQAASLAGAAGEERAPAAIREQLPHPEPQARFQVELDPFEGHERREGGGETGGWAARTEELDMIDSSQVPPGYGRDEPLNKTAGLWFDVMDFGAVGDGLHNDTGAVLLALAASRSVRGGTVHLPPGRRFLLWPFTISHPHVTLRIDGLVICPARLSLWGPLEMLPVVPGPPSSKDVLAYSLMAQSAAGLPPGRAGEVSAAGPAPGRVGEVSRELQRMRLHLIMLDRVHDVTICGSGTVDGRGGAWWHLRRQRADVLAPVLLKMVGCTRVVVANVRFINSPFYHIVSVDCHGLRLEDLYIHAPLDSKNTDGISLMNSSGVVVSGCTVDTGDDNCAVKEGTRNVLVERCHFLNGHGSSIGSIGEAGSYGEVQNITMRNIVFNQTLNAARIKTWQGGLGIVRDITYENLTLVDVVCPLLIEQFYCASSQHPSRCHNSSSAVRVSHVTFRNIRGTQTSSVVGQFLCSDAQPCENIHLADIHVQPSERRTELERSKAKPWWLRPKTTPNNSFKCWNAKGNAERVYPEACLNRNSIGHGVVGNGVLSRSASIGLTTIDSYGPKKKGKSATNSSKKKSTGASCNMFTTVGCT
mmetsp:Transcript_25935/g.49010  ORF Transcript_25935/g.49010 Transcript_25935/m.49010 type:complete len:711 (+) Transcript_25935:346-2478(+)